MPTNSKRPAPSPAAALRTPVRIDQQVQTPDGMGGETLDWAPLFTDRAERIDLSGSETIRAMQTTNTQLKRFKLRWPPSIPLDATMRLVDLTTQRTYNVRDVNGPDQMYRWVTLLCELIPGSSGA